MLLINFYGHDAFWDAAAMQWQSSDHLAEDALNLTIPPEIHHYDAVFRTGGIQGIALKAAKKAFPRISVVKKTEPSYPEEPPPGTVQ